MYDLRDFQKCTAQHDSQAVHTKGISYKMFKYYIRYDDSQLCTAYVIFKNVPHSKIPKLLTRSRLVR